MLKLVVASAILAVSLAEPHGSDRADVKTDDPPRTRPRGFPYVFPYVASSYARPYPAYPYSYHPYPYFPAGYHPGSYHSSGYHPGMYNPYVYHPRPSYSPGVLVYIGKFKGTCYGAPDGLYYVDESSFAFCSNGIKTIQACADGAANPSADFFHPGKLYHYGDFCSINLSDKPVH